jgi:hypothetical protein
MRFSTRLSLAIGLLIANGCRSETTAERPADGGGPGVGDSANSETDGGGPGDSAASEMVATSSWSKLLGPGVSSAVAYDAAGNLVVSGSIWGTFDPTVTSDPLPDADVSCAGAGEGSCYPDGFLVAFDPLGRTLWTKRWIDAPVAGLAVTGGGHISIAVTDPDQVDGGRVATRVATYDATGAPIWTWSVPSGTSVTWLGADANGNVFAFTQDATLTKLDSTGGLVWSKKLGSLILNEGLPIAIAVTSTGGVATFGHLFVGDATVPPLDGRVLPAVLTSFGPTGDLLWSRTIRGTGGLDEGAVTTDPAGNIVVGGSFNDALDLGGPTPLQGPVGTAEAIFVAKYDGNGNFKWGHPYGGVSVDPGGGGPRDVVGAIAASSGNDFLIAGSFAGAIDFGTGSFGTIGNGATNIFLAKVDSDGNTVAAERFGDGRALYNSASSMVVGFGGQIALGGALQGTVDFGSGPLVSQFNGSYQFGPNTDGFVATFSH